MTTAEIIKELEGIARRNPGEAGLVTLLTTDLLFRTDETLAVERALHDAIKIIEKSKGV